MEASRDLSLSADAATGGPTPAAPEQVQFGIYGGMFSAVGDLEGRKYHLFTSKAGRRWVVADQPAAAENIYADGGPGSRGMGGRKISFDLVGGGSVEFIGPWKAGAESLLRETGHDVTRTYFTQGVVALERDNGKWPGPDTYRGILHYDAEPVMGSFNRVEDIAKEWANKLGRRVVVASISKGGGSAGWAEPDPANTLATSDGAGNGTASALGPNGTDPGMNSKSNGAG